MTTFKYYQQVIPEDYLSIVFEHEINGDPDHTLVTWGLKTVAGVFSGSDMTDLADAWGTAVVEPLMSTNTGFLRTTASNAGGVVLEHDSSIEGTKVGSFGPVSNAVIVEKRSAESGRRNRGRVYLPILTDADVDENGRVDIDLRDDAVTAVTAFRTAALAIANVEDLVILHSKGWGEINTDDPREPVPADPGNAPPPTVITHFTSRPILGTQRRRVR